MSRQERLKLTLTAELNPEYLDISDESHSHQRIGVESHFKIIAVSDCFNNLSLIARHRLVYSWLGAEFNTGLHALSLHLFTSEEWQKRTDLPKTPPCYGGV